MQNCVLTLEGNVVSPAMTQLDDKLPERLIHILVADDEEDIRELLRSCLEAGGYYVLLAESGPSALKLAEDFPGHIDLLITDIRMPHMDGIEFARQLHAVRPETKILFMSAAASELSSAGLQPNTSFILKPFLCEDISKKLLTILERSQDQSDPAS